MRFRYVKGWRGTSIPSLLRAYTDIRSGSCFWVVFSFSASLRLLSKLPGFWGHWFSPAGAIICGTTGVLITNHLITNIPTDLMHYATIIAVLVSALLLMLALRPEVSIQSQASFVFLVPLGFHAYFLIAGLVSSLSWTHPFC